MDITNRTVAALTTLAMLAVLFVTPSARAEPAKLQDRLATEALVVDTAIDHARLAAAARRLAPQTVTVETRIGPNTSVLTRVPVTLAQR